MIQYTGVCLSKLFANSCLYINHADGNRQRMREAASLMDVEKEGSIWQNAENGRY